MEDVKLLSAYLHFLSHKWRELGLQLGLSGELLDAILSHTVTPHATVPGHEYHFRMMLIAWIRQQTGKGEPASMLAKALSAVDADSWHKWSVLVQSKALASPVPRPLPFFLVLQKSVSGSWGQGY